MPDFDDFGHNGFGPGEDFGHSHNDGLGHDHSFFGHGGFVNYNHFDDDRFFRQPNRSNAGNSIKGLNKVIQYVVLGSAIAIVAIVSFIALFLQ